MRKWVERAEIDNSTKGWMTTSDLEALKKLLHENRELKRANEILKTASESYYCKAREADRSQRRPAGTGLQA